MLPKLNPDGSDPDDTDHEYGLVPPVAPNKYAYDDPDCAPGMEVVVIASALGVVVDGFTETLALAFFVESAALVAITVTLVLVETDGAVNIPSLEIDPALADQVTAVFEDPCTVAANFCPVPAVIVAALGDTVILTLLVAGLILSVALALLLVFAALVARTVTVVAADTFGAVKLPALEIDPALALHVTAVLLVPCTVAENCCELPAVRLPLTGEMLMLTFESPEPGTTLMWIRTRLVAPLASVAFTHA